MSIATLLSQHHKVTAVDIIPEKVELINNKKSPIQDEYIEKYLAEKELDLTATLDAKEASTAGTQPKGGHPDLQPLRNGGSVRGYCMGRTAEDAACRLGNRERGLGRMKVLLIKPMEHPQVVDIENSLKEFYRILDCDCITATYPWEERAALVTDDNGLFTEKPFSRYIPELEQPIKGNFFICGLGEEDFAELPQDLIWKFRERFWVPEAFVSMFGQMAVIQMDDGTKPE